MLIIGLGNPGKQYENTPHNAGFLAVDHIAETHDFPAFKESTKHQALISEGAINETPVTLAKPLTFMNNSGSSVQSLTKQNNDFVIIHDEVDLPLGTIKESQNSGPAGHKGVASIIQALGTKDFTRIRIGVQPLTGKPEDTEIFVLQKFSPKERELLDEALNTLDDIAVDR